MRGSVPKSKSTCWVLLFVALHTRINCVCSTKSGSCGYHPQNMSDSQHTGGMRRRFYCMSTPRLESPQAQSATRPWRPPPYYNNDNVPVTSCNNNHAPLLLLLALLMVGARGTGVDYVQNVSTLRASPGARDVAVDSVGSLFVTDFDNNMLYRSYPNDTTITISGFYNPQGVTVDNTTNIAYVADTNNHCIISVSITGTMITIAGSCGTSGADDGIGPAARFDGPVGVVYHATGVLYVCDFYNNAVRRINVSTMNVSTVVSGSLLYYPIFLCVNRAGTTLYVASYYNHIIVLVDLLPTIATMTTIAGSFGIPGYVNGAGISALFNYPAGIAFNSDESMLYIADLFNYRIRSIRLSNRYVDTVAGTGVSGLKDGPAMAAQFGEIFGMKWYCNASDGSTCGLLAADYTNNRVRWIPVFYQTASTSLSQSASNVVTDEQSLSTSASRTAASSKSVLSATRATTSTASVSTTGGVTDTTTPSQRYSLTGTFYSQAASTSLSQSVTNVLTDEQSSTSASRTAASLHSVTGDTTTPSQSCSLHTILTRTQPTSTFVESHSSLFQRTSSYTAVIAEPTAVSTLEQLRNGIAATTPVLQYSFGAVSTNGWSTSRMGAVSKLWSCQSPFSPPQGVLSSRIEGCGALHESSSGVAAEYARGDVVLGMSVLLSCAAMLFACCVVCSHAGHMTLQDAAAALSMPSLLLPVWGAALPTGVGGMVALGRNWEGCVGDGVLLVSGAAVVVMLPLALLVLGTTMMLQRLQIAPKAVTAAAHKLGVRCAPLQRAVHVMCERRWSWEPRSGTESKVHLYGRVVVLQHRMLWFATLDAAVLVAVSALAACAVDLPMGTCQALGGAIVALLALQLLVCGVTRPFTTLFEHVVAMTTLALNVVGAVLQLSLLSDAAARSLAAAAALDLLLLGVSGLKAALDFRSLFGAIRRRWCLLMAKRGMQMIHAPALERDAGCDDVALSPSFCLSVSTPQLLLEDDQELDELIDGELDDSLPMILGAMHTDLPVSSLTIAYAAMRGELPWDEEDQVPSY